MLCSFKHLPVVCLQFLKAWPPYDFFVLDDIHINVFSTIHRMSLGEILPLKTGLKPII